MSRTIVRRRRLSLLVDSAQQVAQQLQSCTAVDSLHRQYSEIIASNFSRAQMCEQVAQTLVCLAAGWQLLPSAMRSARVREWLVQQAHPLWRDILVCAAIDEPSLDDASDWCLSATKDLHLLSGIRSEIDTWPADHDQRRYELGHLFEQFLTEYQPADRKRWGVFFTPVRIVQSMISHVDQLLRAHFEMPSGFYDLARTDNTRRTTVLDPAAGSGAFLAAVMDIAIPQMHTENRNAELTALMRRLVGYELLLPACAVAQLVIAERLFAFGFQFATAFPLNVMPANTLAASHSAYAFPELPNAGLKPCLIVVGNPPFSGVSENENSWISDLLRGKAPGAAGLRSYFHVDGRALGERKVWLNDDYVKFFRYAQWAVEQAGEGLIAFVSNHAYLDNATFRGMRESLMQTFPQITILDLHGNLKRRSCAQGVDENVFGIEQGISIGYFVRSSQANEPVVQHADIWGSTSEKLAELTANGEKLQVQHIRPTAPFFQFTSVRRPARQLPTGIPLDQFMPVYCTAPITARDHFVVAFDRQQLLDRMEQFADLSIDDAEIRERFFRRTRSRHYAAGDTRGWKLSAARQRLATCHQPHAFVQPCLYRPFDWRVVFWADWMIDWPRPQITQQAAVDGNWFLITRRQMLPGAPANFFWVSQQLALDGVIRSDNRGSEALFPVYETGGNCRRANFSDTEISIWQQRLRLQWIDAGRGDLSGRSFGPEALADYLYALFQSGTYRDAYVEQMCSGYPPVICPVEANLFHEMSSIGCELRRLHMLKSVERSSPRFFSDGADPVIAPGFPKFHDDAIWINASAGFEGVNERIWRWSVGAHEPCRKWLAARKGRRLEDHDISHYERMLEAIMASDQWTTRLDQLIDGAGGIARAFV